MVRNRKNSACKMGQRRKERKEKYSQKKRKKAARKQTIPSTATCYLYNLPEVVSTFECLRVPTVSARFSTAPFFWNWAMIAVARLAPRGFLEDRAKCVRTPTEVLSPSMA